MILQLPIQRVLPSIVRNFLRKAHNVRLHHYQCGLRCQRHLFYIMRSPRCSISGAVHWNGKAHRQQRQWDLLFYRRKLIRPNDIDLYFAGKKMLLSIAENRLVHTKLIALIRKHYMLLELVSQVSDIFAPVLLSHFLSVVLTISINSIIILLVRIVIWFTVVVVVAIFAFHIFSVHWRLLSSTSSSRWYVSSRFTYSPLAAPKSWKV